MKKIRPQLAPGFRYGKVIDRDQLRVDDVAVLESTPAISYAGVSENPIVRLGPKNVLIRRVDRFGVHDHRIPRAAVSFVLRGKVVHPVRPPAGSRPSRPAG